MVSRTKDTLLLVGNADSAREDLRNIFKERYNILEAENAAQAILLLGQNHDCILLAIIDLPSPNKKDIEALKAATRVGTGAEIPTVAIIETENGFGREERAFLQGAADVIRKPFSRLAVQKRIQVLIDLYTYKENTGVLLSNQREAIQQSNQATLEALSTIIEYRSSEVGNHVLRIRRFTRILLEEVAKACPEYKLTPDEIDIIVSASALHDIGKIAISDAILNKPGRLERDEFEVIKSHTVFGSQMIQHLSALGNETYLQYAYNICLYHHERWDGKGYPYGICGDDIPICAQAVGLADAFDALTTKRVYKPAYPYRTAANMIINGECGLFSAKLLECFKHIQNQFIDLASQYADGYSPKSDHITIPLPTPLFEKTQLSSLDVSQAKYQTMLYYMNDTVLEMDFDNEQYHVIYNPNPDMDTIKFSAEFGQSIEDLRRLNIHPDDIAVLENMQNFIKNEFFERNLRRCSCIVRIFSRSANEYQQYELIFLRVNTGQQSRRLLISVWHKLISPAAQTGSLQEELSHTSPGLQGLTNSVLRCVNDAALTLDRGMEDLQSLVGWSAEELEKLFHNSFEELIFEKDREAFAEAMAAARKTGERGEFEFRLLHKSTKPFWVIAKGRLCLEEDGKEYFYLSIFENRIFGENYHRMMSERDVDRMLVDMSGSIVFDWDLVTDTMSYSPKWAEHFGYTAVSRNYGAQMGIATHFHPDDLSKVRATIEKLKNGAQNASMEVRLANVEGKYLWTKISATGHYSKEGELIRLFGILQDVDEMRRAVLQLKKQVEYDQLTKILNKQSAQEMIGSYLSSMEPDEMAALMVIDLDNFKAINDHLGHLYGDVVLAQVGSTLRNLFRTQDIIGRVGGDEFLVFMKDIPNTELLKERCEALLSTINNLLEEIAPGLQASCSIGVSMAPVHGISYNELFDRADRSLYHVKRKGKKQYKIFSEKDSFNDSTNRTSRSTVIDSDDPSVVTSDSFERFVFHSLYESKDLNATVNGLLAFVGRSFNVSRVYIFENNHDNTACSNTFEWCNDGIDPQIDNLQNVSYTTDIPGWPEIYDEKNLVYCSDITQLAPPFRDILEPQGIKSMLHCAIMDNGVFRGYIGFDECRSNRLWTQSQISQLEFLAEVMAVFLLRERNKK